DPAVSQDLHCDSGVDVKRREELAARMPGVVHSDHLDASGGAPRLEGTVHVARFDRTPGASGEHQAVRPAEGTGMFCRAFGLPGIACSLACLRELAFPDAERGRTERREGKHVGRTVRLGALLMEQGRTDTL